MIHSPLAIAFLLGVLLGLTVILFTLLSLAQGWVLAQKAAVVQTSPGLMTALRHAAEEARRATPLIAVYPDTRIAASVARGAFKPGVILLSQGLLSTLNDDELVSVISAGIRIAGLKSTSLRTFESYLKGRFFPERVRKWTPWAVLRAWMALPLKSHLERQSEKLDIFSEASGAESPAAGAWFGAMHKARHHSHLDPHRSFVR